MAATIAQTTARIARNRRADGAASAPPSPVVRKSATTIAGQQQARRQGDRDGQRERRLNEAGNAIKQACQAIDKGEQQDETADAGGARIRYVDQPPLRRARRKCRSDERPDGEDDDDRLRDQIEQPIHALGQCLCAGNHDV